MYREFDSLPDLDRQLVAYLVGVVTDRAVTEGRTAPGPTAAPADSGDSAAGRPTSSQEEDPDSERRSAQEQITDVLDGFRRVVAGDRPSTSLDPDRLLLFSIAIGNGDALPTHVVNRLYRRHAEISLIVGEAEQWLKTLATDFASEDVAELVVPGWAIVGEADLERRLAAMAQGDDLTAARGALRLLNIMSVRPRDLWANDETTQSELAEKAERWVKLLADPLRSMNATKYLAGLAERHDEGLLRAIVEGAPDDVGTADVQALRAAFQGDHSPLVAVAIGDRYDIRPWARELLQRDVALLDDVDLANLIKRRIKTPLRRAALVELLNRGNCSVDQLANAVDDASSDLTNLVLDYVDARRVLAQQLLDRLVDERSPWATALRPRLMAMSIPLDELRRSAGSALDHEAWEALTWLDGESMADEARQLLSQTEDEWASSAAAELPALAGEKSVFGYLYGRRTNAAAQLLARLSPDVRGADDIDLIRQALEHINRSAKADVATALALVGERRDAPLLAESARLTMDEEREALTAASLRLGGTEFARSLLGSADAELVHAAVQALGADGNVPISEFEALLHSESAQIRVAAVAVITQRADPAFLEALLANYIEHPPYYYNVSASIDRFLYAPGRVRSYLA